jgi:hypothetical protein
MRSICIANEKSTSATSAVPVIGAAPLKCGAQASGRPAFALRELELHRQHALTRRRG